MRQYSGAPLADRETRPPVMPPAFSTPRTTYRKILHLFIRGPAYFGPFCWPCSSNDFLVQLLSTMIICERSASIGTSPKDGAIVVQMGVREDRLTGAGSLLPVDPLQNVRRLGPRTGCRSRALWNARHVVGVLVNEVRYKDRHIPRRLEVWRPMLTRSYSL